MEVGGRVRQAEGAAGGRAEDAHYTPRLNGNWVLIMSHATRWASHSHCLMFSSREETGAPVIPSSWKNKPSSTMLKIQPKATASRQPNAELGAKTLTPVQSKGHIWGRASVRLERKKWKQVCLGRQARARRGEWLA